MKIQVRRSLFKSSIGASLLLSFHSFSTGCADQAHNHDNSSFGITVILSRKLAFLRILLSTKSPVYCDWCNSILGVYPLALFKWITLCNPCPQMPHICF
ncbi:uncharacterized protein F5147DRAFT_683435 [Suillus discolor]|uniref:Uncharacterized protein n=1 Tax=Suillus discolor TaxID=1912936 RepID=A0A9P7JWH9_9AGAM|nr:uncharacterized protein F5147DRAFT_683435 [Suillus discolor]KAG2112561.1 hypothetical protein F5147DRAFT_683435 [Suillus discolor]